MQGFCAKNKTPASRCTVLGYCIFGIALLIAVFLGGAILAASGAPFSASIGGLADTLVEQVSSHVWHGHVIASMQFIHAPL